MFSPPKQFSVLELYLWIEPECKKIESHKSWKISDENNAERMHYLKNDSLTPLTII
jgi:hypothetical protein